MNDNNDVFCELSEVITKYCVFKLWLILSGVPLLKGYMIIATSLMGFLFLVFLSLSAVSDYP